MEQRPGETPIDAECRIMHAQNPRPLPPGPPLTEAIAMGLCRDFRQLHEIKQGTALAPGTADRVVELLFPEHRGDA